LTVLRRSSSLTVTAFIFNKFVHPYENRFVTPREAARLQGFPDDLEFKGNLTSTQLQIGNAVPIPLGQAVFKAVLQHAKHAMPKKVEFNALSLFSGAGGGRGGRKIGSLGTLETRTCVPSLAILCPPRSPPHESEDSELKAAFQEFRVFRF
jgi:DNA (cytosine-5)-methyltransferase 1